MRPRAELSTAVLSPGSRQQSDRVRTRTVNEYSSRAFVLRTRAYSESDWIVVFLTEAFGKISGIARGARRSKRRFSGPALEPFNELSIRFTRKPNADLAFMHESIVVADHHALAGDIVDFAWMSYLSELVEAMIADRDPCPEIFELYGNCVELFHARAAAAADGEAAESLPSARSVAHYFVLQLLDHAGWGPDFSKCSICSTPTADVNRPLLDPRGEGLICAEHEAERYGEDVADPSFRPRRRVLDEALLDYVGRARLAVQYGDNGDPDRAERAATALLDRLIDLHLRRELKSRAFLASVRDG